MDCAKRALSGESLELAAMPDKERSRHFQEKAFWAASKDEQTFKIRIVILLGIQVVLIWYRDSATCGRIRVQVSGSQLQREAS